MVKNAGKVFFIYCSGQFMTADDYDDNFRELKKQHTYKGLEAEFTRVLNF